MKLWFVDDKPDNHKTWLNSFTDGIRASCELRTFNSVDQLFVAFSNQPRPDILFLDFFLGNRLGVEVIRWFDGQPTRPVLIAHSSMEEANIGMVAGGTDFYLEKVKNRPYTESIRQVFSTPEAIEYVIQHRRMPR